MNFKLETNNSKTGGGSFICDVDPSLYEDGGIIAVNLGYGMYPDGTDKNLFRAALEFRKKIFVDRRHYIPKSAVKEGGIEYNKDDDRSLHLAVARLSVAGMSGMIGYVRLIHRVDGELPIERYFGTQCLSGSIEVSRLMSIRKFGVNALFSMALDYTIRNRRTAGYGVIDELTEKALGVHGVPCRRITKSRFLSEYNSDNFGVEIDIDEMLRGG